MQKLNKIERLKEKLRPSEFLRQLEAVDWENPSEEERFYLKNYGIYNIKLRPERWMLRLRFDGGRCETRDLEYLAELAETEGLQILLTSRAQIELHGIAPERVYPLWIELNRRGLVGWQTLTDNFRALLTDPLSDCAPDAHIDTFPILDEIRELFLAKPEWMGTIPRKFNTALIGRESPSLNPWGNDLLFALAQKEGAWGFNLYQGGKNSETARDADIFCLPEEVAKHFQAVASTYKKHGLRGSRSKTRLFHLIEEVGMGRVREWIAEELGEPLKSGGSLRMESSRENRDSELPIRRFGTHGEIEAPALQKAASQARSRGLTLRLTPHQELWLFDPEKIRNHQDLRGEKPLTPPIPSAIGITACAGIRYCPLSLWDIKEDLALLPMERLNRLGVSLGFSGCLKGCGRHYHSDLGLIGLRTNLYGETERAARVFLGAIESPAPSPGRMLYYSVPLRMLDDLIHTILDDYEASGLASFEEFSREVLAQYSIELLQLWYILRQLYDLDETMKKGFRKGSEEKLLRNFKKLDKYPVSDELYEIVRELSHRLWDKTDGG